MNQKGAKQIKKFASAVSKGRTLQAAMLEAGYAATTARRGKAALSKPMWEALASESNKLELLGRKISPERQANLVRGRLVLNTLRGRDNGTQSARILGSDRRIAMWQPESQLGLVVLQAPQVRKIDHEVPLIQSEHAEEEEEE
jgi:hypothetical protein